MRRMLLLTLLPVLALHACASAPSSGFDWTDLILEATPELLSGPCAGVRWSREIATWENRNGETITARAFLELREACADKAPAPTPETTSPSGEQPQGEAHDPDL